MTVALKVYETTLNLHKFCTKDKVKYHDIVQKILKNLLLFPITLWGNIFYSGSSHTEIAKQTGDK